MAYTLENVQNRKQFRCSDEFWLGILDSARTRGWRGEGTSIDFQGEIEEECDEDYSYLWNLFLVINIHMRVLEWDGNYVERERQVVSGDDAQELMRALEGSSTDPFFIDFIAEGGFRILP